jgi:hypothetical protein
VRDFDEFEGGLVKVAFKFLVSIEVAVGLFHDDMAFKQEAFEESLDIEPRVTGVPDAQGDVFQVEIDGHRGVRIMSAHGVRMGRRRGIVNGGERIRAFQGVGQASLFLTSHVASCAWAVGTDSLIVQPLNERQ